METATANCLMLLSKVGDEVRNEKRVFTCKTCMKEFPTFQALGGHRASHKKIVLNHEDGGGWDSGMGSKPKTTSHKCPICGSVFAMGQALGGHMRRHRQAGRNDLITKCLLPEPMTMKKSSMSSKRIVCLDLNLMPVDILNLKLELGRPVC